MDSCIYCDSVESDAAYPTHDIFGNSYQLRACRSCTAVFLTPRPDAALLAQAYDESYYGESEEKFKKIYIEKALDYFRRRRAKTIHKYIASGKVLDIGCGNGRFLSFVKASGNYEIYGLEMEGGSANRAAKIPGIHLKLGTLQPGDYPNETFDAVTLIHVFEHLSEPAQNLETIHSILKPNGILFLSFPNIDSWQSRLFKGKWLHLDPPRHLFFFRPADFKRIMTDLGFELIREKHFNIEYNPFGMSQSILNVLLKNREVLYESLKGNTAYTRPYSRFSLIAQQLFYQLAMPVFILTDAIASVFRKSATVEFVWRKKDV